MGYLISNYHLNKGLKEKQAKCSSINKLVSISKQPFNSLVRGLNYSLGGIMQTYKLRSVPSPDYPSAPSTNYYSGGYITELYSSKEFSKYRINSIQIELPATMRHDPLTIEKSAKLVAFCIFEFYQVNDFDKNLETLATDSPNKSNLSSLKEEKLVINYEEDLTKVKSECLLRA